MLNILNTIDWESVTFRKSNPTLIPDLIRQFHNATSQEEFETYFKEFTELVYPMGCLVPSSKPAAQVLVELLKQTKNPYRRTSYCDLLAYFLRRTQTRIKYIPQFIIRFEKPKCVTHARQRLELYDVVAEGYDIYIQLLRNANHPVQILCLEILSLLTESADQSIAVLSDCLSKTSDEWVKAVIIRVLSDLMRFKITGTERQEFAKKLEFMIENDNTLPLRISIVSAYAEFHSSMYEPGEARSPIPQK